MGATSMQGMIGSPGGGQAPQDTYNQYANNLFGTPGGPYTPRPDLGPGVGFGVGLPQPGGDPTSIQGNQPAPNPLPTDGMGGGKSMGGIGNLVGGALGGNPQDMMQSYNNILTGTPSQAYQPNFNAPPTPFPNQQQPITQGNGQLPPGFGALSPIDRSQIGNAQIGFGMPPSAGFNSPLRTQLPQQPLQQPQPMNRFAPPNAPGVRRAQPTRVAPKPTTRNRLR